MKPLSKQAYVARQVRDMELMKTQINDEISFTVRNGRYCVGCYSSDTVEGLKRILAMVKARSP